MLNFINYLDDRFHLLSENSKPNTGVRATVDKIDDQMIEEKFYDQNANDCQANQHEVYQGLEKNNFYQ